MRMFSPACRPPDERNSPLGTENLSEMVSGVHVHVAWNWQDEAFIQAPCSFIYKHVNKQTNKTSKTKFLLCKSVKKV